MVYWLALKLLPTTQIIVVVALVLGLEMIGIDVITPAIDYVTTLVQNWVSGFNFWGLI